MLRKLWMLCALALSVLVCTPASADFGFIDSFEDGNFNVITATAGSKFQPGLTCVLGGTRNVDVVADGNGGSALAELSTDGPGGAIDDSITLVTDSNTAGFFQFSYGVFAGAGDLGADLVNVDMNQQWTEITMDYIANADGNISLTLRDGGGNEVTLDRAYVPGTGQLSYSYADLAGDGVFDFTDVDGVRVNAELDNSPLPGSISISGIRLDGIQAIPEPGFGLAGMLLGAFAMRRRRS